MTPTPRTDAIAHRGLGSVAYIAEMTDFARQLEREIAGCREWSSKLADFVDDLRAELADAISELDALRKTADKLEEDKECNARLCESLSTELDEWREMINGEVGTMREELAAERELADRLAGVLLSYHHDLLAGEDMQWLPEHDESLAAWKEARSGTV